MKLKRLLEKVPGGKSRIGSYAAALYLIKEHDEIVDQGEILTEEQLEVKLNLYMEQVSSKDPQMVNPDMDALFEAMWDEDAPANSAGSGNIAGIGVGSDGEPGRLPKFQKKKKSSVLKRFKDTIPTTPKG